MAALTRSRGSTVFVENLFADRFRHVPQLIKMGAQIRTQGQTAIVTGVQRLQGATVQATDLRGAPALVVAGRRHGASPGWSRSITSSGATPI